MSKAPDPSFETTLKVRDTCLCLHAQRAARAVGRRFDHALRPLAVTNGQFSLLMSLNRPNPPAMGPVAALLAMDRTTLTAALKPLQRRGWVEILPDPADRRGKRLALTPEGRDLLARALPVWEATQRSTESLLPDGNAGAFRSALAALS